MGQISPLFLGSEQVDIKPKIVRWHRAGLEPRTLGMRVRCRKNYATENYFFGTAQTLFLFCFLLEAGRF